MMLFLGFYFGCLLMIALYNIHWYGVTKEKSYLYYALFKVSIMSITLINTEIISVNIFFKILNANIIFILIFLFSKEFLDLKHNAKKINTAINCLIVFVLLCFLYSVIFNNYSIFDQPYSLLISPFVILGCFVYWQGFKPAKYYVAAWGLSISLIAIDDLNLYGVINFHQHIPFTLIGHIIESIILSYAIFVKTTLIVKEKNQQNKILIQQAKLASMGGMLENIAHQWRQPLNRIATFIINMQMYVNNTYKKDAYISDLLDQSQLQLEYMSKTIADFSRFNKPSTEKEKFLASMVVDDAYAIIGKTLEKNSIAFNIEIEKDFSLVSYSGELIQVVLNLLQNSQDELLNRKVKKAAISIVIDNNKITVQDNAGGIDSDIIDRIFEPYFTTNSKKTSLGLGLHMCKMILERHFNATIEIDQSAIKTNFNIIFKDVLCD